MAIILKPKTIEILFQFAKNVTKRGLLGELPSPEKADADDLRTYQDAACLYEAIEHMKKNDKAEWEKLLTCDFVEWSDPRTNIKGQTFEYWYDNVFKNYHCVSAFKATVARFLYEQVENPILDKSEKTRLILQYQNDYFDLSWKIQYPLKVLIEEHKMSIETPFKTQIRDKLNTSKVHDSTFSAGIQDVK